MKIRISSVLMVIATIAVSLGVRGPIAPVAAQELTDNNAIMKYTITLDSVSRNQAYAFLSNFDNDETWFTSTGSVHTTLLTPGIFGGYTMGATWEQDFTFGGGANHVDMNTLLTVPNRRVVWQGDGTFADFVSTYKFEAAANGGSEVTFSAYYTSDFPLQEEQFTQVLILEFSNLFTVLNTTGTVNLDYLNIF